jgi:chemotaxis receptor (MCP) glutamine deamidase CheD
MPTQREITVAPDRFEVAEDDAILLAELRSAIAVCVYDAVEEAGALLHLRCIVRTPKPVDVTDSTLATELLLLLDRCVQSMRELSPSARNLQARVVAHVPDHSQAQGQFDIILDMVRHFLTDAGARVLPLDIAGGEMRALRFRPSMGWVQIR